MILSGEQEKQIIELYKTCSAKYISTELKLPSKIVLAVLKKNNIPRIFRSNGKDKIFDKTYFAKIDSHDKAYWLGFLYADGNVCGKTMQLRIMDLGHLDKMKVHMKSEHKVNVNDGIKYQKSSKFAIRSQILVNQLKILGVEERKSLTLSFPNENQVPQEFVASFMLGYFDGDGSIGTYMPKQGNRKWSFRLISTHDFCKKYNDILVKECDLFDSKIMKYKRIPDKDIWEIHICGVYSDRLERIYNFLYKNINFGLKRKQDRFLDIIKNNPKEHYGSKYYGVSKSYGTWRSQWDTPNGHFDKRFVSEIDAAKFVDSLIKKYKMDERYLNFPNE